MALVASTFMTAPGLYGTGLEPVDMSDVLAACLKDDTALLGQIKMSGEAKDICHKFIEDSLNQTYVEGYMSNSTSIVITSPSTTAKVQQVVRTNAVLVPGFGGPHDPSTSAPLDLRIQIQGTPYNGETSTAVYGPISNGFALTSGITVTIRWYVVQQPKSDVEDVSADISKERVIRSNYTQVFERGIHIEDTRKHIPLYAIADEQSHQIEYRTKEIKIELLQSVLHGSCYDSGGTPSGERQLRTMAGIKQLIRDPGLSGGSSPEDKQVTNAGGAQLSDSIINAACEKMFNEGGLDEKSDCCIVVGGYQARMISAIEKEKMRMPQNERERGFYGNKFITDMGYTLDVIVERNMFKPELLIIDRARARILPLRGDGWHLEKMAKTGRSQPYQLSGQYTLELRNADACHHFIYGLKCS